MSSLTIFYLIAVMIVYNFCINIIDKNEKEEKGQRNIKTKAKKRHLLESWLKKHSQKEAMLVIPVRQLGT